MPDYLLFTLAAPMGAFGDLAGHERRGTAAWPGRSALLGLLGAALGIDRSDEANQRALAEGYGVAVATLAVGCPMRDYHTIQSVPRGTSKGATTRAEALARAGRAVATSITIRDYRADCAFTAALWPRPGAHWPLEDLATALRRPVYTLWLGRKGCPLAAPLAPRLVPAPDVLAAFSLDPPQPVVPKLFRAEPGPVASDLDGLPSKLPEGVRQEQRWDQPHRRDVWQFAPRSVALVPLGLE